MKRMSNQHTHAAEDRTTGGMAMHNTGSDSSMKTPSGSVNSDTTRASPPTLKAPQSGRCIDGGSVNRRSYHG